jgi:hypothetical protein
MGIRCGPSSGLEALQNTAKCAHASGAQICLQLQNGTFRFTVSDDGAGYDVGHVPMRPGCETWPTGSPRLAAGSRSGPRPASAPPSPGSSPSPLARLLGRAPAASDRNQTRRGPIPADAVVAAAPGERLLPGDLCQVHLATRADRKPRQVGQRIPSSWPGPPRSEPPDLRHRPAARRTLRRSAQAQMA